jgi:vacuolar-type H+-ATPase subunit I/STV1
VNYTLGYGLISLLFGIYLLVYRNDLARSNVGQRRWLKRWLGLDLPGQSEERQKPYWVMLGVVFVVLGVAMIVIGGYWWMTS